MTETSQPLHQAVPDDRGPDPAAACGPQVMAEPMLYHRAPAFVEVYARVLCEPARRLPDRQRRARLHRLRLRGDGVGGRQPRAPGRARAGGLAAGKFGERWVELCEAYGADAPRTSVEWGTRSTRPSSTAAGRGRRSPAGRLRHPVGDLDRRRPRHPGLAEVAHRHGALLAVDAVSASARPSCDQDAWGIDVVVAGSQKALMCPPGPRASPSVSRARARARPSRVARRPLLLRLGPDRQGPAQGPARQPVHAGGRPVHGARRRARADPRGRGPRRRLRAPRAARPRHARAGVEALDLELFGARGRARQRGHRDRAAGRRSTAARCPSCCATATAITVAGGQSQLKGQIVRIAHCGYFGAFDILTSLGALEMALTELGHELELGRRRRRRAAGLPRGGRAGAGG